MLVGALHEPVEGEALGEGAEFFAICGADEFVESGPAGRFGLLLFVLLAQSCCLGPLFLVVFCSFLVAAQALQAFFLACFGHLYEVEEGFRVGQWGGFFGDVGLFVLFGAQLGIGFDFAVVEGFAQGL